MALTLTESCYRPFRLSSNGLRHRLHKMTPTNTIPLASPDWVKLIRYQNVSQVFGQHDL